MTGLLAEYLAKLTLRMRALRDPEAQAQLGGYGDQADELADTMALARRTGRLHQSETDFDEHARHRGLLRVWRETDAALKAYLQTAWAVYASMGAKDGLEAALARLGCPRARVVRYVDLIRIESGIAGPFISNSPFGHLAGFFYVEIDTPHLFGGGRAWDDGLLWEEGALWDIDQLYARALSDVIATIRRWKHVGSSCRFLRIRIGHAWVTVPVGEWWEVDPDGNVQGPYLEGY